MQPAKRRNSGTPRNYQRLALIVLVSVTAIFIIINPTGQTFLGWIGFKKSVSIKIIDNVYQRPVYGVELELDGQTAVTDSNGIAIFNDVRLGERTLRLEADIFYGFSRTQSISWYDGSIATQALTPKGYPVEVTINDWLSDKPLGDVLIESELAQDAVSDGEGLAILWLPSHAGLSQTIELTHKDYLKKEVSFSPDIRELDQTMVIARRHFVAANNPVPSVFSVAADGSQKELVAQLPDMTIIQFSYDTEVLAVVAETDGVKKLLVLDAAVGDPEVQEVDSAVDLKLLGWADGRLIYFKQNNFDPAESEVQTIASYRLGDDSLVEVFSATRLNDVLLTENYVYVANGLEPPLALYRVRPDGSQPLTIVEGETRAVIRLDSGSLAFYAGQQWYQSDLDGTDPQLIEPPDSRVSRLYNENPFTSEAQWARIDPLSGELFAPVDGSEKAVFERSGLRDPVYWLSDDHLIARVYQNGQAADVVISLSAGAAQTIGTVEDIRSYESWYYAYE